MDEWGWEYVQYMCLVMCNLCLEYFCQDCEDNDKNGFCELNRDSICNVVNLEGKEFVINVCVKICNMCSEYYGQ